MYYKVINTESELYKKLHILRTKELAWEEENVNAIEEKSGHTFDVFIGHHQQTGLNRVTDYSAFEFNDGKPVDKNVWRNCKNNPTFYEPNTRTKAGREMKEFLSNGLKRHSFHALDDALGLTYLYGRFSIPFLEIEGPIIKLFLDDRHNPKYADLIEITRTEFNEEYKAN